MKTKAKVINLQQAQELRDLMNTFAQQHQVLDDMVRLVLDGVSLLDARIEFYGDTDRHERRYHVERGYPLPNGESPWHVWDKASVVNSMGVNAASSNPTVKRQYDSKSQAKIEVDRLNKQHEEHPKHYEVKLVNFEKWKIANMVTEQWVSDEVYTSLKVAYEEECRLNGIEP